MVPNTTDNGMYINIGGKELRRGYTTGTCATAASEAAAKMLVTGGKVLSVNVMTPKGIAIDLPIEDISRGNGWVRCAVRKDGGDDIDVTDGSLIYSEVRLSGSGINIEGGEGVGRVTKKGLDQPVGAAAINQVPRRMISEALEGIRMTLGYDNGFDVLISIPNGRKLAEKTFNPRLGIEGGISILGTSGIVEPMSEKAIMDTIKAEMSVRMEEGCHNLLVVPGNYGASYAESICGLDPESSVKCSNYIGETLDYACELGFEGLLLVGNLGKLVKLAGGIMNTHSRESDARMEIIAANAAVAGASIETVKKVMDCISTDDALDMLDKEGMIFPTVELMTHKMEFHMKHRSGGRIRCGAFVFSSKFGMIGKTPGAELLLEALGGSL